MRRRRHPLPRTARLAVVFVLLALAAARADVSPSLPLQGHCRAGRYMPVRIHATEAHDVLSIESPGSVPTELDAGPAFDAIVPWLPISESVTGLEFRRDQGRDEHVAGLKALDEDQRLVGLAGEEAGSAGTIFPNRTVVPVALDLSVPLLQPAAAWECLDGVLLSRAALARLNNSTRAELLAAGTTLAVRSGDRPDSLWPWRREGEWWVLRYDPAGPRSAFQPDAYGPTYGWDRGWPSRFRREVVLFAALFCIAGVGLLLWRPRGVAAAFVVLTVVAAGAFELWRRQQSPMLRLNLGVLVRNESIAQYDAWSWQSPIIATAGEASADGLVHPAVHSLRQIEATQLRLHADGTGQKRSFRFRLGPKQSLAFCGRSVRPAPPPPVALGAASGDLSRFADELYVSQADRIAGEFTTSLSEAGPARVVVIDRR